MRQSRACFFFFCFFLMTKEIRHFSSTLLSAYQHCFLEFVVYARAINLLTPVLLCCTTETCWRGRAYIIICLLVFKQLNVSTKPGLSIPSSNAHVFVQLQFLYVKLDTFSIFVSFICKSWVWKCAFYRLCIYTFVI